MLAALLLSVVCHSEDNVVPLANGEAGDWCKTASVSTNPPRDRQRRVSECEEDKGGVRWGQ